jgi:hypothetical protein
VLDFCGEMAYNLSKERIKMNYESWIETYKPVANSIVEGAPYSGTMFETYGAEFEQVKATAAEHIWTLRDADGETYITAGFGWVNRLGYFITSVPWGSGNDSVQLSEEDYCECYKEDGYEVTGELQDGDPDCSECEGYGRVTRWLD